MNPELQQISTHALTFLLGAAVGAAGSYYAQKFTDQRRRKEDKKETETLFEEIEELMPDLLAELKEDLDNNPAAREFFVVPNERALLNTGGKEVLVYHEDKHPNLYNQLAILENNGLILDITPGNTPKYRLSEDLVRLARKT